MVKIWKNGRTVLKGGYSVLLKSELLVIENVAPMSLLHPHFILEILPILTFQRFSRFFMTKKPKKEGWNFVNFGQNAGIPHSYSKRTEQRTLYRDRILERKSLTGIKRHKDQRILVSIKIKLFVNGSTVSKLSLYLEVSRGI